MDHDTTWYGGRPRPRRHCVRWRPSSPTKGHRPQFLAHACCCNVGVLWPNGWMDQGVTWHGGRPRPKPHCVIWGSSSALPQKGAQQPPTFRSTSIVAKRSPISATAELLFHDMIGLRGSQVTSPVCAVDVAWELWESIRHHISVSARATMTSHGPLLSYYCGERQSIE